MDHRAVLNRDDDDQFEVEGYRKTFLKTGFAYLVTLLLAGAPYLFGRWYPQWKVRLSKKKCSLLCADTLLVTCKGDFTEVRVEKEDVSGNGSFPAAYTILHDDEAVEETESTRLLRNVKPHMKTFNFQKTRYVWSSAEERFEKLHGLDEDARKVLKLLRRRKGVSDDERINRHILYGKNSIDVEVKSYFALLTEEVLNPFYIFQIFSMILWSLDEYVLYASCIFVISVASIAISVYEIRQQSQALHDMVSSSNDQKVTVVKGSTEEGGGLMETEIDSVELVPGDLILIPSNGCTMTCDAVLVSGTCIVNESMLTGESVPVTKSALAPPPDGAENEVYEAEGHKKNTLFAGTSVIQTRYYGNAHVVAVVTGTGFSTSKGELVKSILFPKNPGFKFYEDSMKFILFLSVIAMFGMAYCVYVYVIRNAPIHMIVLRCLDIVTIVVPPALPAAMTIGTAYAQRRLKKGGIFCLQPKRINVGGKLKAICFDKTGTLTEDGLDMHSVVGVGPVNGSDVEFLLPTTHVPDLGEKSNILACLASCHSLTLIDNSLIGDPLDVKMFEATGWEIEEPGMEDSNKYDMLMPTVVRPKQQQGARRAASSGEEDSDDLPYEVGIIRQFTFSSAVARMSVVTRVLGEDHFSVFTKGAPEKLEELCLPETIPANFHDQLRHFTLQGYRVIGLAYKDLPQKVNWLKVQKIKREAVESELRFLGLLVMRNMLKPETTPVIAELKEADVRCVMVTGDNLLTAVSVARDCRIIGRDDRVVVVEADPDGTLRYVETEDAAQDEEDNQNNSNGALPNGDVAISVEPRASAARSPAFHLAVSGKTWATLKHNRPDLLPSVVVKGTVFARMAPDQKAQLVEDLQAIDYVVSMCGDGANDCGALKAADVGISLSEAEASVAAPFTSKRPNITCVPDVIKEGRCSLVSSFGMFKFMALYSIIQFVTVLILYTLKTNLGDAMFLYIDLVILGALAIFMGSTKPYPKLVKRRPPGSLVSFSNLFSICVQILAVLALQLGAFFFLQVQPWYVPVHIDSGSEEIVLCWESTTLFIVSSFQYLAVGLAFSRGPPFRQPFYTNYGFASSLIVLTAFTAVLGIYPGAWLAHFLEIMPDTDKLDYRLILMAFPVVHLLLAVAIEYVGTESRWLKAVSRRVTRKKEAKNKYKRILSRLDSGLGEDWPPVVQTPHERGVS